ncbi:MAG: Zn-dependent hydrolase [Actinomycetales bacterium]|nr:MAG: Zn-dependent hydrolase [Actinomycetales bacterium]
MRVQHLGHSCVVVEVADRRLLIDPGGWSRGFEELTGLDAVIVTHQHADHLDQTRFPGVVAANPQAALYADPQSAEILGRSGLAARSLVAGSDITLGEVTISPRGEKHAFNHDWMPTVDNVGVRISARGEPTFFHPGDALDADTGPVDLLAVPVNAPWCAVRDTIAFVRRVAPGGIVPIHDGLVNPTGRALYLTHVVNHGVAGDRAGGADEKVTLHDLAGQGAVTLP